MRPQQVSIALCPVVGIFRLAENRPNAMLVHSVFKQSTRRIGFQRTLFPAISHIEVSTSYNLNPTPLTASPSSTFHSSTPSYPIAPADNADPHTAATVVRRATRP